ncbi:MAG: hypothetical protein EG823_04785 [Actinobacteria bacterium]|nr:hypothetical protein [Actinomycetota bacterium]
MALSAHDESLAFLHAIARWSRWIALATALAGSAITRDLRFGLACAIAAAIDIWMLSAITERGRDAIARDGAISTGQSALAALVGGRLAVKAVLLALAALMPQVFPFWGTVAGVLVVDTTMVIAGGPAAALRAFRPDSTSR